MIDFSELIREGKHVKVFVEPISTLCHSNHDYLPLIKDFIEKFFL